MSKLFTRFVCVVFVLICAGCSRIHDPVPPEVISVEVPFGISWDQSKAELDVRTSEQRNACESEYQPLRSYFSGSEYEIVISDCIYARPLFFELDISQLPDFFSQGEAYGVLRGEQGPSAIEYAYLHKYLPQSEPTDNDRRKKHSDRIKAALKRAYGRPDASGVYEQGSVTGFVPQNGKDLPCDLWVRGDVAILLCSRRVVLIDGIEASLSFIKLPREPYGEKLAMLVSGEEPSNTELVPDETDQTSDESMSFTLMDWLGPEQFDDCDGEELRPLEEVWALPVSTQKEVDAEFGMYAGDELATKAIALAESLESSPNVREQEQKVMYLFSRAASEGSAIASNEIGASLLHCYQGVEQDIPRAVGWLRTASEAGDPYAKFSLAKLITQDLASSDAPRVDALTLLRACAEVDYDVCGAELRAMEALVGTR